MPQCVRLFQVFVSTPGDVTEEHLLIDQLLLEWNLHHGSRVKVRLEAIRWRTHTFPATGGRPQALINEQAFDQADLIVALFWTRFGSPTGRYDSGTEEEIRRGMKMKKPVMVYFSDIAAPDGKAATSHQSKIARFKKRLGGNAIYFSYNDVGSFERAFRQHLALAMNRLLTKNP